MFTLTRQGANEQYNEMLLEAAGKGPDKVQQVMRELGKRDLFFLLTRLLGRVDADQDWIYRRCREVQLRPNGYLDLWAREHYKSTIITFALNIQEILNDPDITIGIFSHTKPIAKAFLGQIKTEFQNNELLKEMYPDILWGNPKREAPKWSLDSGITVKRKSNPKEATVEAWGLVDGQPTSKHFKILCYDDVVTRESVTSTEMIGKTTDAWALSLNLGAIGGYRRYIGTRYHYNDTYKVILDREAAIERRHPATKDGTSDGEPVLLSREELARKRREMGVYIFGCQMLQDPKADSVMGFNVDDIRLASRMNHADFNLYILVDPASEKKKENDYTVMVVIGLGPDENYYLVDMIRDRLNLTEKAKKLINLHKKYKPVDVGYEQYGMQADIHHIEYVQDMMNYRFKIKPLGGNKVSKEDRIRRLVPVIEYSRFYIPSRLIYIDLEGKPHDLAHELLWEEVDPFPVGTHDDMLDAISRIMDPEFPTEFPEADKARANQLRQTRADNDYDPLNYFDGKGGRITPDQPINPINVWSLA